MSVNGLKDKSPDNGERPPNPPNRAPDSTAPEIITAAELAERWRVPVTWIFEQVRSRARDPLPCLKFGRYTRFDARDPKLAQWLERRRSGSKAR